VKVPLIVSPSLTPRSGTGWFGQDDTIHIVPALMAKQVPGRHQRSLELAIKRLAKSMKQAV
jgi:hypothetical protein